MCSEIMRLWDAGPPSAAPHTAHDHSPDPTGPTGKEIPCPNFAKVPWPWPPTPPPPPSPEAPQLPTCSEHGPKLSQNFARPSLKITPLPTDSRPQIPAAKAIAPGWGKSGAKLTGGSTL